MEHLETLVAQARDGDETGQGLPAYAAQQPRSSPRKRAPERVWRTSCGRSSSAGSPRWGKLSQTKYNLLDTPERVTVTRANHPLQGQQLEVLRATKEYISVRNPDGAPMAVPRAWTDADGIPSGAAPGRPRAIFTVDALRALAELVEALQRRV
jgi:hypothetical protein